MDNGDAKARQTVIREIATEIVKQISNETPTNGTPSSGKWDWLKYIPKFFQHPAVLLVIGFAITGWVGARLANHWQQQEWDRQQKIQNNEWERQQLRLIDIHGIDLKYKIIDEITKAIGDRNAAAKGILSPLQQNLNDQQLIQAEKEPLVSWEKVSHDWRVNSQILKLKIATYIGDPDAAKIWEEISQNEKQIAIRVVIVKNDLKKYGRAASDAEAQQFLDSILNYVNETEQALKRLVSVIAAEARSEIKKQS